MTSCLIGLVYWKTIELYWPRAIWHIYQEKRNEYLRCFKEEHAGLSRDDLVKELNDVAWGSAGGKWLRELGGPFVCLTGVCTREGDLGKVGCNPKALKMKSSRRIIVWINLSHCQLSLSLTICLNVLCFGVWFWFRMMASTSCATAILEVKSILSRQSMLRPKVAGKPRETKLQSGTLHYIDVDIWHLYYWAKG